MVIWEEKLLEGNYWAAAVAEGDADGGSFTDNGSNTHANFCNWRREKDEYEYRSS